MEFFFFFFKKKKLKIKNKNKNLLLNNTTSHLKGLCEVYIYIYIVCLCKVCFRCGAGILSLYLHSF